MGDINKEQNALFSVIYKIATDLVHAGHDEVVENAYNLSVSTYVEAEDTREKVDIVKLNAEIKEIVAREQVLRDEIDKIIADIEGGQEA